MHSLRDQAKADWQKFTSDPDGFGTTINFTAPAPGSETASIIGLATKHHINIDTEGNPVNTKNVHISVAEQLLVDAAYPIRDANDEVDMLQHRVNWVDSAGNSRKYIIQEIFPDETVGILTFILADSDE